MVHQIKRQQVLNSDIDILWDFISNPYNLKKITPSYMGFQILTKDLPSKIYPGMMIFYKVKPVMGVPIVWTTEITHMKEKYFFVDEQRMGPYTLWHHEHKLEKKNGSVLMTDIVTYSLPLFWIGSLVNRFYVSKKLKSIFDYRERIMNNLFNT